MATLTAHFTEDALVPQQQGSCTDLVLPHLPVPCHNGCVPHFHQSLLRTAAFSPHPRLQPLLSSVQNCTTPHIVVSIFFANALSSNQADTEMPMCASEYTHDASSNSYVKRGSEQGLPE